MGRSRKRPKRKRIGRVSYYPHHGSWYVYYREGNDVIRRRVAESEEVAARVAAQINAQLKTQSPTFLAFTPISITDLQCQFLAYHENVRRSSLATTNRYRTATQHLVNFVESLGKAPPKTHEIPADRFVGYLRSLQVHPNGHPNAVTRPLRDKGIRYILEVCRTLYNFAARKRYLPPYAPNPFSELEIDRLPIENAKPHFIFDADSELAFLKAADDWAFPIHFTLAKTGLRPGELAHLLIEDLDLDQSRFLVRNKPGLEWRVKTRSERDMPLVPDLLAVIRRVIGSRTAGPVFRRKRVHDGERRLLVGDAAALSRIYQDRLSERSATGELSRSDCAKIARTVWRDAGAIDTDLIRRSFIRIMNSIGFPEATCAKNWRHTFATLLQDANVDPLIRQETLGHKPSSPSAGALGMTSVYTHTRRQTQEREIDRALRLWPRSLEFALQWSQGGAQ